jgi:hypothetical protein
MLRAELTEKCSTHLRIISSELSAVVHAELTPAARAHFAKTAGGGGEGGGLPLSHDDELVALLSIVKLCREGGVCLTTTKRAPPDLSKARLAGATAKSLRPYTPPPALKLAVKATLSPEQISTASKVLKDALHKACPVH